MKISWKSTVSILKVGELDGNFRGSARQRTAAVRNAFAIKIVVNYHHWTGANGHLVKNTIVSRLNVLSPDGSL